MVLSLRLIWQENLPGLPTRPSVPPERLSLPKNAARLRSAPVGVRRSLVRRSLGHRSALGADSAWWVAFALACRVVYASEKLAERALPFDHRAVSTFGAVDDSGAFVHLLLDGVHHFFSRPGVRRHAAKSVRATRLCVHVDRGCWGECFHEFFESGHRPGGEFD